MEDTVEMQLSRVIIQDKHDQQYIQLQERSGERTFPIVIGFNEAWEIHRKLRKLRAPRPMTHDLIGRVISQLQHELHRVVITELKDSTFYAVLVLIDETGEERGRRLPAIRCHRLGRSDRCQDLRVEAGARHRRARLTPSDFASLHRSLLRRLSQGQRQGL